jgi:hypothetical protein
MKKAVIISLICIMFTGCSSFHGKWKETLKQTPSGSIAGPWEGRWVSDKNGHTGRLRCVMTPESTNSYRAHFHAIFWKILRAAYEVPFTVTSDGIRFQFSGESDLGTLGGGKYTYEGSATPLEFTATYRSKYDHGRFEMKRP